MSEDKVESRTEMNDCPKCGGTHFGERKGNCPLSADYVADKPWPKPVPDEVIYSSVPDVARPSVPQQGQSFREMYTISTNGSYYTRNSDGKLFTLIADVAEDYAAQAAIRSIAQQDSANEGAK